MASLIAGVFIAWAAVSVAGQFSHPVSRRIRRWDAFGLVPLWIFFAPNPIGADHYLYYRDHSTATTSPWRRAFDADRRHWYDAVWRPRRREEKALTDAMFHLLDLASAMPPTRLHASRPYLTVLAFVSGLPHDRTAVATQFVFCTKRPGRTARPLFVSAPHRLSS